MKERIHQKLAQSHGFSLTEMLAVVVVLTLVSMVMATGLPAAIRAYEQAVDAANSQVLLSTTIERMRDELSVADTDPDNPVQQPTNGHAEGPESHPQWINDGKSVTYYSFETGCLTVMRNATDEDVIDETALVGVIMSAKYKPDTSTIPPEERIVLTQLAPTRMSTGASKLPLACSITSLKYEDGVFKADLQVTRGQATGAPVLAKAEGVTVRPVATPSAS